jgi:hypothetical protein
VLKRKIVNVVANLKKGIVGIYMDVFWNNSKQQFL